ncbi:MAG: 16S rRNA (guanine(527)-N(7))-methyltransferase RsmG [bacterium JZ-2024 1]
MEALGKTGIPEDFARWLEPRMEILHQFVGKIMEIRSGWALTGWKTDEEIWRKGVLHSLYWAYLLKWKLSGEGIDVGSGAGFPGIPLCIAFPDLHLTLLESHRKKVAFLREVVKALNLKNAEPICQRAEILAHHQAHREHYDWVFSRALGGLPLIQELTLPFAKIGGKVCHLKGEEVYREILPSLKGTQILGGKFHFFYSYEAPGGREKETVVVVTKVKPTPLKYPRRPGIPQKRPLSEKLY